MSSLLEINDMFKLKGLANDTVTELSTIEEVQDFKKLLLLSPAIEKNFLSTSSAVEFFKSAPELQKGLSKVKKMDLFYAAKSDMLLEKVPSYIVYFINQAYKKCNYPNLTVSRLSLSLIKEFISMLPEGISLLNVLENIAGQRAELFNSAVRKTEFKGVYELYIPNIDKVVIIPKAIADEINTIDDYQSVQYVKGVGVCLGSIPLRVFNGALGIVCNEFNLLEVR